jgi:hypothetical protein
MAAVFFSVGFWCSHRIISLNLWVFRPGQDDATDGMTAGGLETEPGFKGKMVNV